MKKVTMLSFHGKKPAGLSRLIDGCQDLIRESGFRRGFEAYEVDQVHGTLIGMEKVEGDPDLCNANIWRQDGERVVMNFSPLLETIRSHLPMMIRFGGFGRSYRGFTSFGKLPFERSFQVQRSTTKVTLIGWPHMNEDFSSNRFLEAMRMEVEEKCNIKHKYSGDNDLYMVMGEIADLKHISQSEHKEIEDTMRNIEENVRVYLENNPIDVEIEPRHVCFARYQNESLPPDSTETYCINKPGIDVDFIMNLYR